jgi:hypothetical protein
MTSYRTSYCLLMMDYIVSLEQMWQKIRNDAIR